ncbi:MAG: ATP synthase subunit I [Candidatus Acidiferrum sp.]
MFHGLFVNNDLQSESHPQNAPVGSAPGAATERRIAWVTLVIGAVAAGVTGISYRWIWAAGLLIGSVLAWFNFRWLRRGMDALVAASTAQADAVQPRVPVGTYFRALFRYGLIAISVYVIFKLLGIPLVSMVLGLLALGAAAIAASVYEVWHPVEMKGETQPIRGLK